MNNTDIIDQKIKTLQDKKKRIEREIESLHIKKSEEVLKDKKRALKKSLATEIEQWQATLTRELKEHQRHPCE